MKVYSVLPLRNTVLFPNQIIPIYIGREQSLSLINDISKSKEKDIIVVAQKDGSVELPKEKDFYEYAKRGFGISNAVCRQSTDFLSKPG